jgi:undecaprenyl-diphosphatase
MPKALVVTLCLLLAVALALSVAAAYAAYFPLDLRLTQLVQRITVPGFRPLMIAISWLGNDFHWAAITLVVAAILSIRRRIEAKYLLACAVGAWVLNNLLKFIIARPRPSGALVEVYTARPSWSFPSGHVMNYVALFGFLFYLTYTLAPSTVLRTLTLTLLGALLGLVGLSRVYLGAHWASDVLGGYLFGAIWLAVVIRLYLRRVS